MAAGDDNALLSELEVLESIYLDELVVCCEDNRSEPWEVSITLYPATAEDQNSQYVRFTLVLSLPTQYPDAAPKITIRNPRGLSDDQIQNIQQSLKNIAEAGIGGPVLYELIEKGKEILTSNNVPYCQCVICLYGFQENEAFTKTACYHYFHSHCLARYVQHTEEELRVQRQENEQNRMPPPQQEPGVMCPVCREPLNYDLPALQAAPPPQLPSEVYVPDCATLKRQQELQRIFEKQQAKGGIIDPEAERNRFFISLQQATVGQNTEEDNSRQEESTSGENQEANSQKCLPPAAANTQEPTSIDRTASAGKEMSILEQVSATEDTGNKEGSGSLKSGFKGQPEPCRRPYRGPPDGVRPSYRQHENRYGRGPREFSWSEDREWSSKRSGKYKPEFSRSHARDGPDENKRPSPVERTRPPPAAGPIQSEVVENSGVQLPDPQKGPEYHTEPVGAKEKSINEMTSVHKDGHRGRGWRGPRPRREWDYGKWEKPKGREPGSYSRTPRGRGMFRPWHNENRPPYEPESRTMVTKETI